MVGSFNFGKNLFCSGKKEINVLRSWKDFCWLICYSGKTLFSLGKIHFCWQEINVLGYWKNFCWPICYSRKNLFSLGRINFCSKVIICSNPEKISIGIVSFSVLALIYFCPIWKIFLFQSKMRQKRVIFNHYFGSISKYFG